MFRRGLAGRADWLAVSVLPLENLDQGKMVWLLQAHSQDKCIWHPEMGRTIWAQCTFGLRSRVNRIDTSMAKWAVTLEHDCNNHPFFLKKTLGIIYYKKKLHKLKNLLKYKCKVVAGGGEESIKKSI